MAENKTKATTVPVMEFLNQVESESRQKDSLTLIDLMQEVTGEEARMWGPSIIGFGSYHYRYDSGREGDSMLVGFSPRKAAISLYIMGGYDGHEELRDKLGKITHGKGCIYAKKLADVDMQVLREMVEKSVARMQEIHTTG